MEIILLVIFLLFLMLVYNYKQSLDVEKGAYEYYFEIKDTVQKEADKRESWKAELDEIEEVHYKYLKIKINLMENILSRQHIRTLNEIWFWYLSSMLKKIRIFDSFSLSAREIADSLKSYEEHTDKIKRDFDKWLSKIEKSSKQVNPN